MKNIISLHNTKFLAFLLAFFCMASCSKKTAFIPQQNGLMYVQNLPQQNADMEKIAVAPKAGMPEQNMAEATEIQTNTLAATEETPLVKENAKAEKPAKLNFAAKRKMIAAVKKLKDKSPKELAESIPGNWQTATLLASAAKGNVKAMLDGNLKLAIVFLIISLIAGYFSWLLGAVFGLIGLIFLLLWILSL